MSADMHHRCDICGHSEHDQKDCDQRPIVRMLSRPEMAHQFAVQHAQALLSDDQQTGDASDGCGESPDGSDDD